MKTRPAGSLGRQLSTWLALLSLFALIIVCGAIYVATHKGFGDRQREDLAQKQSQLLHLLAEATSTADVPMLIHKLDDFLVGHKDLALSLRRADGSWFYRSTASPPASDISRDVRFDVPSPESPPGLLAATLALDTQRDAALLRRVGLALLAAALGGTLIATAGALWLVRLGLQPVRALVEQMRCLGADTLHHRLDGSAQPEELAPLVAQFNDLLDRVQLAYAQLEGFNADVAHEILTPLATLTSSTEFALRKARNEVEMREVLGSNLEDLQRVARIVRDMLFLSHADRGDSARRTATRSLAEIALQVVEYHEAAMSEAGIELRVVGDADGAFDITLLQRALSNLLANATRYAEQGSTVLVEIKVVGADEVTMLVINHGPTIESEYLPRIFDRFYRKDHARSDADQNHGLGLSIVAAIARMHGGRPLAWSARGITAIGLALRTTDDRWRSESSSPAVAAGTLTAFAAQGADATPRRDRPDQDRCGAQFQTPTSRRWTPP